MPRQKWLKFSNVFSCMKTLCLDLSLTDVCSGGSYWQKISIDSVNGLAPNWCQAISWTNDDQILRCHMASLGHNELMFHGVLLKLCKMESCVTLHSQSHGCWWPGAGRSQGISKHGTDPVFPKNSSFCRAYYLSHGNITDNRKDTESEELFNIIWIFCTNFVDEHVLINLKR